MVRLRLYECRVEAVYIVGAMDEADAYTRAADGDTDAIVEHTIKCQEIKRGE